MKTFRETIIEMGACHGGRDWVTETMTEQEAWDTCPRGDWMLWYYTRKYPENIKERVFVAGHCANTVRHSMKDERSVKAVDAAISFGEGRITKEELKIAAYAAYAADAAAYAADAAYAAAYAAYAADAAAYAAYAADAADAADAAADADAAMTKNRLATANICREVLTEEVYKALGIWDIK